MFPRLSYLEWMAGRADVAPFDLGTSGLQGDRSDEFVLEPEPLVGRSDPPVGATLEHLLAQEYDVDPEQVLVTAGATHANVIAFATVTDGRGDSVLVEAPAYEPLVETPRGFGFRIERFDRDRDGGLDAAAVEGGVTEDTAMVVTSNRHNPTGHLASRDGLAAVAEAAGSVDATLLVDEVYAPYVLEDGDGPFGGPTAAGLPNTVITGSLTKFFGLGDLRIGWLIGPREFVQRAREVAYHVPDVAGPSRVLGERALFNATDLAADQRELLDANHGALTDFVDSRPDLAGEVHPGSSFAFLEPVDVDVSKLVEAAWEEGVLVVPGHFFGEESRIRVSGGRSPTDVSVSLGRLGQALTEVGQSA